MNHQTIIGHILKYEIDTLCTEIARNKKTIIFRGTNAYTNNTLIALPAIDNFHSYPRKDSDKLRAYAIHEAAHCRYTEFDKLREALIKGQQTIQKIATDQPFQFAMLEIYKKLINTIEDRRIEHLVTNEYRGTTHWLSDLHQYLIIEDQKLDIGSLDAIAGFLNIALYQSKEPLYDTPGQELQQIIDRYYKTFPAWKVYRNDFIRLTRTPQDTAQTIDQADQLFKILLNTRFNAKTQQPVTPQPEKTQAEQKSTTDQPDANPEEAGPPPKTDKDTNENPNPTPQDQTKYKENKKQKGQPQNHDTKSRDNSKSDTPKTNQNENNDQNTPNDNETQKTAENPNQTKTTTPAQNNHSDKPGNTTQQPTTTESTAENETKNDADNNNGKSKNTKTGGKTPINPETSQSPEPDNNKTPTKNTPNHETGGKPNPGHNTDKSPDNNPGTNKPTPGQPTQKQNPEPCDQQTIDDTPAGRQKTEHNEIDNDEIENDQIESNETPSNQQIETSPDDQTNPGDIVSIDEILPRNLTLPKLIDITPITKRIIKDALRKNQKPDTEETPFNETTAGITQPPKQKRQQPGNQSNPPSNYEIQKAVEIHIKDFQMNIRPDDINNMTDYDKLIGPIQQVGHLLKAQTNNRTRTRTTHGTFDTANIISQALNEPDVFKRRAPLKQIDTALLVLVDQSGSTQLMLKTLYQIGNSIANLETGNYGLKTCFAAFTSIETGNTSKTLFLIVKDFHETPISSRLWLKRNQNHSPHWGLTPTGEATIIATRKLLLRKESRKILMIVTDGEPNNPDLALNANISAKKLGIENCILEIGKGFKPKTNFKFAARATKEGEIPKQIISLLKKLISSNQTTT